MLENVQWDLELFVFNDVATTFKLYWPAIDKLLQLHKQFSILEEILSHKSVFLILKVSLSFKTLDVVKRVGSTVCNLLFRNIVLLGNVVHTC